MLRSTAHPAHVLLLFTLVSLPKVAWGQAYWDALPPEELQPHRALEAETPAFRPGFRALQPTTAAVVRNEYVLPAPGNPNMMFGNVPKEPVVAIGVRGGLPFGAKADAAVRVDTMYDTGFVGGGPRLLPSSIALDGTDAARRRGHTLISANSTQLNVNLYNTNRTFRGDVQLDFDDTVRVRQLKGQVVDPVTGGKLYGGVTWTTFMDEYAVPVSLCLDTTAAGTVFRRQAQLGYTRLIGRRWSASAAIELGPNSDFTLLDPNNDVRLQRYPDLVMRLHYASSPDVLTNTTFHLAALVRGIGYEDVTPEEHFVTGWGVSGMGKIRTFGCDHLFAGFVSGEGLGSYVFGFAPAGGVNALDNMPAAGPDAGELAALSNVGSYLGYSRVWSPGASMTSVGYGYAYADTTNAMPATAAKRLQNAWINHQWRVGRAIILGVEYHYTLREVRDGTEGDNHRIMLATQFLN